MIRVVKLGGSLLSRTTLVADLRCWLGRQSQVQANLFIVGGGDLLNAVRDLNEIHCFDDAAMHWRCIRMLRPSFEMLSELLPDWGTIATHTEFKTTLARRSFSGNLILAVDTFFTLDNDGGLAQSWATTSDSIAATLARRVRAEELVVLKSCQLDSSPSLLQYVQAGVLDPQFPFASDGIPNVRIEKLPHAP